jgi:hypothetical protein
MQLVVARVEPDVQNIDGLGRSDPESFTACALRGAEELAQTLQHPSLPERRLTAQVATVSDQPVGVPNVLHAE